MDRYAKAIMAALVAAYALYQTATGADSAGGSAVVAGEWAGLVAGGLVAGLAVWAVPNKQDTNTGGQ
jgi:hypothetical protein